MTSIPLVLPLRTEEAAALAELVYQQLEGKTLTEDQRKRFASRVPSLALKSFTPFPGSLQRDPIHLSTYYIAVDARGEGAPRAMLLRIALGSSPASGLFPGAMLIGRMRTESGREVVMNAIPFDFTDHGSLRVFAEQVDRAFLPRRQGPLSAIAVASREPERTFPVALQAFRNLLKATGANLACVVGDFHAGLWAAIRAGWREGYSAEAPPLVVHSREAEPIADAGYTSYPIDASAVLKTGGREVFLKLNEDLYDRVTRMKADFETSLRGGGDISSFLRRMKERGRHVDRVTVDPGADLKSLAETARQFNVTLSFAGGFGREASVGGRFHYRISAEELDSAVDGPGAYIERMASALLDQDGSR
jgi:hypothetical protein